MVSGRAMAVRLVIGVALVAMSGYLRAQPSSAPVVSIPFAEAARILQTLPPDERPRTLDALGRPERETIWPEWVASRDAAIRQRVLQGDEDTVINWLLFGTTFTKRPRPTDSELDALVTPSGIASLRPRIDDFIAAVASAGDHERLDFARSVLSRVGVGPDGATGTDRMRRYLEERVRAAALGAAAASEAVDAGGAAGTATVYRDRGLSSDTSLLVGYGIDRAIEAMGRGRATPATISRVAIVGPGLDFTDKLGGYDFYPPQTIQPFAVIDSLVRHGLSDPADLRLTVYDLSARVLRHFDTARARAAAGTPYTLVLPLARDRPWTPGLVEYWEQMGGSIGEDATPPNPPAAARVQVRSVRVSPSVVLATTARDLNIVLQREDRPASEAFDLVIATNILLYYDRFEQALAVANIASMLRPDGLFLTNTSVVQPPGSPLRPVGYTDTVYATGPRGNETGDRIWSYAR